MKKEQLGNRMKFNYEQVWNIRLPFRMPVIVRLDGRNFHTFTRQMRRPFDERFIDDMSKLLLYLCQEVHTTVFGYCQSDEISLLLHPYKKLDTEPFYANEIQKITSITAGLASSYFTQLYNKTAIFDSRCFILPEDEVVNYFIWRQQDATRNSINMVAQSKFSHKELQGVNTKQMQEMMFQKDETNWNDFPIHQKRGLATYKKTWVTELESMVQGKDGKPHRVEAGQPMSQWQTDFEIPIFSKDRKFISKYLGVEE